MKVVKTKEDTVKRVNIVPVLKRPPATIPAQEPQPKTPLICVGVARAHRPAVRVADAVEFCSPMGEQIIHLKIGRAKYTLHRTCICRTHQHAEIRGSDEEACRDVDKCTHGVVQMCQGGGMLHLPLMVVRHEARDERGRSYHEFHVRIIEGDARREQECRELFLKQCCHIDGGVHRHLFPHGK